jgi:hypothetical protein
MKTQIKLAALALVLSAINSHLSTCFAQGDLTPPGTPAPTMKSLDQIEARTPISSAPFTISQPGSYYLTTNVSVSSGDAITIATNGVALDLNGFTLSSTEASPTGNGILLNSGLRNITIANGFIQGGVTNDGTGVYSGSGFGYGIYYSGNPPVNVRVSGVSVSGCLYHGIRVHLNAGDSTVVESCTVRTVGSYGIVASTIKTSSAIDCGITAIYGYQVSDCRGHSTGSGFGVSATTALNCHGQSGGGNGVDAFTALNCYGYCASVSDGVYAYTAQNCYGYSGVGYGVNAFIAQNCYGETISGYGVGAGTAHNCFGIASGSGYGVNANRVAIGCYGSSGSGTGLFAFIANVCSGSSISTTHNVNSF